MPSSTTDNADITRTRACAVDKEDTATKQVTAQIEELSIENVKGASSDNADKINCVTCAACGKEGDKESMNICNKCKIVHYCNVACKKKHRSKHKKKCDRQCELRAAELHEEALFKEPPPPEECPICMLPLPIPSEQSRFKSCCGKLICNGCNYAMSIEAYKKGKGKEENCAFCRTPPYCSVDEDIERAKTLIQNGNANGFCYLANHYATRTQGMPQDYQKANELYLKAGELGCAMAYRNLGCSHNNGVGVEVDKKRAKYFHELAAIGGDVNSRHILGGMEAEAGNLQRAKCHFIIAANAGNKRSLGAVKIGFKHGLVTKDEYANTLRAYQKSVDEMKSEARDIVVGILAQRGITE